MGRTPWPATPGPRDFPTLETDRAARLQQALLAWYAAEGSNLPWRGGRDPYAVLVSEFMLQQTQRSRVIPKYQAFLERFPTIASLAAAPASAVIRAWSGLGYNRRALALHAIARQIAANGGALPVERSALGRLPGVGPYTAGAIACFGFGQDAAFVDTNIRRVLRRAFSGETHPEADAKRDEALAEAVLPAGRAYDWNSALMDLGARVCTARAPRCSACPLQRDCLARPRFQDAPTSPEDEPALRKVAEGAAGYQRSDSKRTSSARQTAPYAASDRYLRGRIVEVLRALGDGEVLPLPELALAATGMALPPQDARVGPLVARLVAEGLVAQIDDADPPRFRLPD